MSATGTLQSERTTLRPTTQADQEQLRIIRSTPQVRTWWDDTDEDDGWWLSSAAATRLAVVFDDQVIGMIQWYENADAEFPHAGIDIFLDPAFHGRGLGKEAVRRLLHHLIDDRQHHRVVIDPAANNAQAVACYRACGFRDVGVMKFYQHHRSSGSWYDGLLMEYVVDPEVTRR